MMKYVVLTLLWLAITNSSYAQVADSFGDGDFTQHPRWFGDDSLFQVSSGILRLKGTVAGEAALVTLQQLTDSVTWTFYTRMSLNPSSANYARFYLMSDSPNLKGPLNGYYVQLGGSTGNTDSIGLYRQQGLVRTRLIGGRPGTLGKTQNQVRVRVWRDAAGGWRLFTDTLGGYDFVWEGSATDSLFLRNHYCGWYVKYTSGYSQHHYLDEVDIAPPLKDTQPPVPEQVLVQSSRQLLVQFNEPIHPLSLQPEHFVLQPQHLQPTTVTPVDPTSFELLFNQSFANKQQHTLLATMLADTSGNLADTLRLTFAYYSPQPGDVLMTEWMPDPTPPIALPDAEYVELFNHSGIPLNLLGYTLSDGSSTATLPAYVLAPDSFVVICSTAGKPLLEPYCPVLGVAGFPSLNNSADHLVLRAPDGTLQHELNYTLQWYGDATKQNGGWSLELMNPNLLCRREANVAASTHPLGGTPGKANSQWFTQPDTTGPALAGLTALTPYTLLCAFNEPMDSLSLLLTPVNINPSTGILKREIPDQMHLLLTLNAPLQNHLTYTINLSQVADCSGNQRSLSHTLPYLQAESAAAYDVLIHEIMANPGQGQSEYVELYNRSHKAINLGGWVFADGTAQVTLPTCLLKADSFVVLTAPGATALTDAVLSVSGFPTLNNSGELLTLYNDSGRVVHAITYTDQWHADARARRGGVSLEMVDSRNPCGSNNWTSCADSSGGTPGAVNSVAGNNADVTPPVVTRLYPTPEGALCLFFSEPVDSNTFYGPAAFSLYPDAGILTAAGNGSNYQQTLLWPGTPFKPHTVYTLTVQQVADCAGNAMGEQMLDFGLPIAADSNMLVINELLFNPATGGCDFVEVYNTSQAYVDLKQVFIGHYNAQGQVDVFTPCMPQGFMLAPGGFAVFTPDTLLLRQQYFCAAPGQLIAVDLPPMPDDQGNVALFRADGTCLEVVYYDAGQHHPLLREQDGVSLERRDPWRNVNDPGNWTSAAFSVGYATPTYANSQLRATANGGGLLVLDPVVFSPDGDGFDDVMNLRCVPDDAGYTGTLTVYNDAGEPVLRLLNNTLLGSAQTVSWDGRTANGGLAPAGIYLFVLELVKPDGTMKQSRKVGVLAQQGN